MTNIVSGGRGGYFGSDYFLILQGCSITTTRKHAYQKVYVYYFHNCTYSLRGRDILELPEENSTTYGLKLWNVFPDSLVNLNKLVLNCSCILTYFLSNYGSFDGQCSVAMATLAYEVCLKTVYFAA